MNYRQLGKSGFQISEIGFGCMSLGEDDKYNASLLHKAIDAGINFFDTADLYQKGGNEITVGRALHRKRDKVFIATKVGNQWKPDGSGWDWNPSRDYIIQSVEKSLARLQTDYIDLYQLHGGTIEDPIDDTIEAFDLLKQQGKIRHYGISSIRPNVIREYVKRSDSTSVMMQYSFLDRRPEESCVELLANNNIGLLARGTLASGLLIDKPAKRYLNYTEEQVAKISTAIKSVSDNKTSVTLKFVLNNSTLTSAITGIRTKEQLDDVIAAYNAAPIAAEQMDLLSRINPVNYYEQHR